MIERFCQHIGHVCAKESTFRVGPKGPDFPQQEWRVAVLAKLTSAATRDRHFSETELEGQFDTHDGKFVLKIYVVTSLRLARYQIKTIIDRKYKISLMEDVERWVDALNRANLGFDAVMLRTQLQGNSLAAGEVQNESAGERLRLSSIASLPRTPIPILGTVSGVLGNSELDLTINLDDRYDLQAFSGVWVRPRRKGRFIDLMLGESEQKALIRVAVKDLDKLSRLMLQHRGDEGSLVQVDLEVGV